MSIDIYFSTPESALEFCKLWFKDTFLDPRLSNDGFIRFFDIRERYDTAVAGYFWSDLNRFLVMDFRHFYDRGKGVHSYSGKPI